MPPQNLKKEEICVVPGTATTPRHTCALIMLAYQNLDLPDLSPAVTNMDLNTFLLKIFEWA